LISVIQIKYVYLNKFCKKGKTQFDWLIGV
jgi:hypothetical protein